MSALLDELNPEQRAAVMNTDGPLLVLAGAGSGKTGVLTRRIAYLVQEKGVPADKILAVTFTNKAAAEMKHRVLGLVGEIGEKLWISTFHSTCARVLRYDIEELGVWTKRFAIYDDDDQLRIIKDIVTNFGYDPERVPPAATLSLIDHHKNRSAGTPDDLIKQLRSHLNDPLVKIWREYEDRMKAADALDFNDLIRLVVRLWREKPEVLARWQARFTYVLVDEYQDTNRTQYELLRLLTRQSGNLAVVGDDDQSIYGFRGADISNILGFKEDYPSAVEVRLEQNYRCTKNILAVANAVVSLNVGRMRKVLWTAGEEGRKVTLIACDTPREEAARVASGIRKLHLRDGHAYGTIAVIYRTNATSRIFEQALRDERIPHKIVGGRKFYERREVRDVLAYLRLIVNPADDAALLRIINVPTRGIGAKTLSSLRSEASALGLPLLKAARVRPTAKDQGSRGIASFVALIDEIHDAARDVGPAELVHRVLDRSGYSAMLEASNTPEDRERVANLAELVRDASEFEPPPDTSSTMDQLRAWLDQIALTGQDEEIPAGGQVTLMTVHNAKGLEYDIVYVVHMIEGQFPHSRSMDIAAEVEEERRLAYVAFTRAKQRLIITRPRMVAPSPVPGAPATGLPKPVAASRFLYGLPEHVCEGDLASGDPVTLEDAGPKSLAGEGRERLRTLVAARRGPDLGDLTLIDIDADNVTAVVAGRRVHHPSFGVGEIASRSLLKVVVRFPDRSRPIALTDEHLKLVRE